MECLRNVLLISKYCMLIDLVPTSVDHVLTQLAVNFSGISGQLTAPCQFCTVASLPITMFRANYLNAVIDMRNVIFYRHLAKSSQLHD